MEIVTIVLIILKATERIECSWFTVFIPEIACIILCGLYVIAAIRRKK